MRALKNLGSLIKNFMILFSFIVSLILVIVLVVLLLLIFDIKNNIATPLIGGLHSSFVGLDESTIDWTIPVRDRIPVVLNIPLETETVVVLTRAVPLAVNANITLPGVGQLNNATVFLQLPAGLELPVRLDLDVPVDEELDIALDVRAVIPISETQLHDPINNLRLLFEPIVRILDNLPADFDQAGAFVGDLLAGRMPDLLAETEYSRDPWVGFSQTAGVGYTLGDEPWPMLNQPVTTGIVQLGGIPALDEGIRPDLYANGTPDEINRRAFDDMTGLGVPAYFYDGSYATYRRGTLLASSEPVMEIENGEPDRLPSPDADG
ncbi:MAG: hypothetical protein CUN53_07265 [Phototrophicales bacterium]|nr:MAG: hypothetical protein CUN53_07265 [Phototrophicales bacterium]